VEEVHLATVAVPESVAAQTVEQQSPPEEQFSPPPLQAGATGVAHDPLVHEPEQHWLADEQALEPERHWPAGWTQMFEAQELPSQQSALDPQSSPTALHCDAATGSKHVPLQATEQHSDGSTQAAPRSLHEAALTEGSPPPPEPLLPQEATSARRQRANAARTGRLGMRMVVSKMRRRGAEGQVTKGE
jgi:hypothetical protein